MFEEYVLSKDANVDGEKRTNMLGRFLGGLLHPFIHAGYGAEFGLLVMWAEGLAEASVEQLPVPTSVLPESLFETTGISGLAEKLASATLTKTSGGKGSPHALTILGRVAVDPAFKPSALGLPLPPGGDFLTQIVSRAGDKLVEILEEWTVEATREDLEKKVEEVIWMNSVIYSVAGYGGRHIDANKEFNANFLK